MLVPVLVGVVLAVVVALFARTVGLDRDRAFWPTVLVVVATYYDLFAVMGGSRPALLAELVATSVFVAAVVVGFRRNLWFVAVGMVGHGVFDFFHSQLINDPGVPAYWPAFCGAFDVVAGAWIAIVLFRRPDLAPPGTT